MERLPVISLFSGAGGLDLAVEHCLQPVGASPEQQDEQEPLRISVALDSEPDAAATLRHNFACSVLEERSRYWTFLLLLDPDRPATTLQAQPGPWVCATCGPHSAQARVVRD